MAPPAARGKAKRRANDPPKLGRPSTNLQAPKPARRTKTVQVLCPCCNEFVSRETAWRHSKGIGIPIRAQATQKVKSLAGATANLWQAIKAKLRTPTASPTMQPTPQLRSPAQGSSSSSGRPGILERLSIKMSSPRTPTSSGSPMALDSNPSPNPHDAINHQLDTVSNPSASPAAASSPRISEWATQHHRVTVEDVPDDEDNTSDEEGEDEGDQADGVPVIIDMEKERETAYAQQDEEDEEVRVLILCEIDRALPELRSKLTEEQVELLKSYILGESEYERGEVNYEDLRRLELEKKLAIIGENLSSADLKLVRAFALKIQDNLTIETFDKFEFAFPDSVSDTYKAAKARIVFLASFNPTVFDCCPESCMAYTGTYSALTTCPFCGEERFRGNGTPRKRFTYIPIIQRLQALFKHGNLKDELSYRHKYETTQQEEDKIQDIFDGSNYKELKGTFVNVEGQQYTHTFFNDPRDIALGLSTDGFCPFKQRKQTCWPIILYLYNLPPDVRFSIHRILCAGVVPGPKKPKDFDSFLWPLVQELLQLARGVKTYDGPAAELFQLRAYLIAAFGDYPAMSMLLQMKGHNGIFPCRMCLVEGLLIPEHPSTTHYVPLNRSTHPSVIAKTTRRGVSVYDPAKLPLRTHTQFMNHARLVQHANTDAQAEALSKGCGIKGIPLISCLPSLFFPKSFPFDFMHLVYENLIKNLVRLWTGKFKDLNHSEQDYYLSPTVWETIGEATARSGSTIPGAYGARPQDVAEHASQCTADAWSFWALYLGPILLQRRFTNADYYTHFIKLVKLINLCLQFTITKTDVQTIREGFQKWVLEYERLYYKYDPDRLSACPVTIHALLHIADGIEACGPVWVYWAFPTERFCGFLGKCIKNRRFPFANLDAYCVDHAQLSHIQNRYNLHSQLNFKPKRSAGSRTEILINSPEYEGYALVFPRHEDVEVTAGMKDKILARLAMKFGVEVAEVAPFFSQATVDVFGRLRQKFSEAGETMIASQVVSPTQDDHRDASYVRYEQDIDVNARYRNREVVLERRTFYGQLLYVFLVKMPAAPPLGFTVPTAVALAALHRCDIELRDNDLDIQYYRNMTLTECVEIQDVKSLVGRVAWDGWWAIIDRSGDMNRDA